MDIETTDSPEEIAIVGLAGRFPEADTLDDFWKNICEGKESIRFFTKEELLQEGIEKKILDNPKYVRANGILNNVEYFDALFFGFSPREAETTDPQHRLFLECSWELLESAGYCAEMYNGKIGVYAGSSLSFYLLENLLQNKQIKETVDPYQLLIGNDKDFLPTRVSYKLNLTGPSMCINTACSTSLVAVHQACQALLDFQCDMAIAGAAGMQLPQNKGYLYNEEGIYSPDGHCRAFDEKARGTVAGNGIGVVLLKRLNDAVKDRDYIYAVIKGSAINNDGANKIGYTAPGINGQMEVIAEAQGFSGVDVDTINYIETHGTGTMLGDPAEISALTQAFRINTQKKEFCAIGSVKANIGHLDTASGIAGLIKTVLALKNKQIPPSINYEKPNPVIDFKNSPFYVNTELSEWKTNGRPRRAGVSAFGLGGTNAHLVLEEAPEIKPSGPSSMLKLITVSGKTITALKTSIFNLLNHLKLNPDINIADVCYTLQVGRKDFKYKYAITCRDRNEAISVLETEFSGTFYNSKYDYMYHENNSSLVFMFPGEEAQYLNMMEELYINQPYFKSRVDECAEILKSGFNIILPDKIFPENADSQGLKNNLKNAEIVSIAVFVLEYSLARLWIKWGIKPDLMIGNGVGEYVAAVLSGVFSLRDAFGLIQLKFSEPDSDKFNDKINEINLNPPCIPFISNVTGTWIKEDEAVNPDYWMRNRVEFSKCLFNVIKENSILLEVGPGNALSQLSRQHPAYIKAADDETKQIYILSSLPDPKEDKPDNEHLLNSLGKLWILGASVNWPAFSEHEDRCRIPLPTYPFHRKRYWIEPTKKNINPSILLNSGEALENKTDIDNWFYKPDWVPVKADLNIDWLKIKENDPYLIFLNKDNYGENIANKIKHENCKVVKVKIGNSFKKQGDSEYSLNPESYNNYVKLFMELKNLKLLPKTILNFYNISDDLSSSPDDIDCSENYSYNSLLLLVRSLDAVNYTKELKIYVVSNNMQSVTLKENLCSLKALLLGPVKVIPQEYSNISCISIDFQSPEQDHDESALKILKEITLDKNEQIVAYRNNTRFIQTYNKIQLNSDKKNIPLLKNNGVYLITGGLGGIGLTLSNYLAKKLKANLILTGFSFFPDRKNWDNWLESHSKYDRTSRRIRKITEIEQYGSNVTIVQADVSVKEEMQKVISEILKKYNHINGIIHAAGIADGAMIANRPLEDERDLLAAKVKGTLVLESLVKDIKPDFFILCSSINSISGLFGQVAYCSANAFLDCFAHYNNFDNKTSVISINWDEWKEVGMAVDNAKQDIIKFNKNNRGSTSFPEIKKISHHLFSEYISQDDKYNIYITYLSVKKQWFLDEHRIIGKAVLPGTGYIELITAAFRIHCKPNSVIKIKELYFLEPLFIGNNEEKEARIILKKEERDYSFFVVSKISDKHWNLHAKGSIDTSEGKTAKTYNIEDIEQKCRGQEIIDKDIVLKSNSKDMSFGPRWNSIHKIIFNDKQGIAFLKLREEYTDDCNSYYLHPAVLDSATMALMLNDQDNQNLPFSYSKITIFNKLPGKCLSYVKKINNPDTNVIKFNISILDQNGKQLLEIKEYALRSINRGDENNFEIDNIKKGRPLYSIIYNKPEKNLLGYVENRKEPDNYGINPPDGIEVFTRVLNSMENQIIVSTRNLDTVFEMKSQIGNMENTGTLNKLHDRPQLKTEYTPPGNDIEIKVEHIWQKLLGINSIGIYDNFFELGGDSLLATQVISYIQREIGIKLTLKIFLEEPTISNLSGNIEEMLLTAEGELKKNPFENSIKPLPEKESYILSSAQERLWLLTQQEKGASLYNFPQHLLLTGKLNRNAIEEAFKKIIERHESLRTVFIMVNDEPRQKILEKIDFRLKYIDLSKEKNPESKAKKIAHEEAVRPFDLENGPLLRVCLMCLKKDKHVLTFTFHHIIADGLSSGIISNEFSTIYNNILNGEIIKLKEFSIQYKDFAEWQKKLIKSEIFNKQKEYWLNLFKDRIPLLDMPLDFTRPRIQSYEGDIFEFELPERISRDLVNIASRAEATIFMVITAVYNILLWIYTQQEDIVVGTPVSGRIVPELDNLIGMFVNIVVLRNYPEGSKTFSSFLNEVRQNALNAFDNQDYQFDDLVFDLKAHGNLSRHPIIDTVITMDYVDPSVMEINELKVSPFEIEAKVSRFDLLLVVRQKKNKIDFAFEYRTKLFKRSTIKKFAENFIKICNSICKNEGIKLMEIDLLGKEQKKVIDAALENIKEDFKINMDF